MPRLSQHELNLLERIIHELDLTVDDFSPQEKAFLELIAEKYQKWGTEACITPRQWEKIYELVNKAGWERL